VFLRKPDRGPKPLRGVRAIGESCFDRAEALAAIEFTRESQLGRLEESYFFADGIAEIAVPPAILMTMNWLVENA
jgi:hypothetical protein